MNRPLCDECKSPAMTRFAADPSDDPSDDRARYLCCECTIRMTRVAEVQGKLLDVHVFDSVVIDTRTADELVHTTIDSATASGARIEGFRKVDDPDRKVDDPDAQ